MNMIVLFAASMVLSLLSCHKKNDCDAPGPDGEVFIFRLLDKSSNTNLIAAWGAKYDSELVDLTKEDGSHPDFLEIRENGKISFVIPNASYEALEQEKTQTFFLLLPDGQGNPGRDIDTLSFTYKFTRRDDCPAIWYESFSASYNDSLYHDGEFKTHSSNSLKMGVDFSFRTWAICGASRPFSLHCLSML